MKPDMSKVSKVAADTIKELSPKEVTKLAEVLLLSKAISISRSTKDPDDGRISILGSFATLVKNYDTLIPTVLNLSDEELEQRTDLKDFTVHKTDNETIH